MTPEMSQFGQSVRPDPSLLELAVYATAGQWRDRASNRIMREPSKVVQIVLPGHDDDMTRLSEIAETYKARFKQQSVITIVRPACVSF